MEHKYENWSKESTDPTIEGVQKAYKLEGPVWNRTIKAVVEAVKKGNTDRANQLLKSKAEINKINIPTDEVIELIKLDLQNTQSEDVVTPKEPALIPEVKDKKEIEPDRTPYQFKKGEIIKTTTGKYLEIYQVLPNDVLEVVNTEGKKNKRKISHSNLWKDTMSVFNPRSYGKDAEKESGAEEPKKNETTIEVKVAANKNTSPKKKEKLKDDTISSMNSKETEIPPKSIEEKNEKLKPFEKELLNLLQEGKIKKVVIHGQLGNYDYEKEGGEKESGSQIYARTDIDSKLSAYIVTRGVESALAQKYGYDKDASQEENKVAIEKAQEYLKSINFSVEFIPQGFKKYEDFEPSTWYLDTTKNVGTKVVKNKKGTSVVSDHHIPWSTITPISASSLAYNKLVWLGVLDKKELEKEGLNLFKDFVTDIDNFSFIKETEKNKDFKNWLSVDENWSHTLFALYEKLPFSTLQKIFEERQKNKIPYSNVITEEEYNMPGMTVAEKGEDKNEKKTKKILSIKESAEKMEKIARLTRISLANFEKKAEKMGLNLSGNEKLGKVFIDIEREDGTGRLASAKQLAIIHGYDTYVLWSERTKSFFISSLKNLNNKELVESLDEFSGQEVEVVRGNMILLGNDETGKQKEIKGGKDFGDFLETIGVAQKGEGKDIKEKLLAIKIQPKTKEEIRLEKISNYSIEESNANKEKITAEINTILGEWENYKRGGDISQAMKDGFVGRLTELKIKLEEQKKIDEEWLMEVDYFKQKNESAEETTERRTRWAKETNPKVVENIITWKTYSKEKTSEPEVVNTKEDEKEEYKYEGPTEVKDDFWKNLEELDSREKYFNDFAISYNNVFSNETETKNRLEKMSDISDRYFDYIRDLKDKISIKILELQKNINTVEGGERMKEYIENSEKSLTQNKNEMENELRTFLDGLVGEIEKRNKELDKDKDKDIKTTTVSVGEGMDLIDPKEKMMEIGTYKKYYDLFYIGEWSKKPVIYGLRKIKFDKNPIGFFEEMIKTPGLSTEEIQKIKEDIMVLKSILSK